MPTRLDATPLEDAAPLAAAAPLEDTDSRSFTHLVDKITQTAMLLVIVKLVASWAVVAAWGVTMQSRLIWGFIPYAGLQTSPAQFRTVASWSTAIVAVIAALWTLTHFLRRNKHHPARTWAAAASLPMAGLLALFEWLRHFNADHLIPTGWLVPILLFLAIASVLFLGFIEYPGDKARAEAKRERSVSLPKISAQP